MLEIKGDPMFAMKYSWTPIKLIKREINDEHFYNSRCFKMATRYYEKNISIGDKELLSLICNSVISPDEEAGVK